MKMTIKDYISLTLLKMIEQENDLLAFRRLEATKEEIFQINCEESFLRKLKEFAESI